MLKKEAVLESVGWLLEEVDLAEFAVIGLGKGQFLNFLAENLTVEEANAHQKTSVYLRLPKSGSESFVGKLTSGESILWTWRISVNRFGRSVVLDDSGFERPESPSLVKVIDILSNAITRSMDSLKEVGHVS